MYIHTDLHLTKYLRCQRSVGSNSLEQVKGLCAHEMNDVMHSPTVSAHRLLLLAYRQKVFLKLGRGLKKRTKIDAKERKSE